jgi:hypothetical protein
MNIGQKFICDQIELLNILSKKDVIDDKMSFSELIHEEDKDTIAVNSVEKNIV